MQAAIAEESSPIANGPAPQRRTWRSSTSSSGPSPLEVRADHASRKRQIGYASSSVLVGRANVCDLASPLANEARKAACGFAVVCATGPLKVLFRAAVVR